MKSFGIPYLLLVNCLDLYYKMFQISNRSPAIDDDRNMTKYLKHVRNLSSNAKKVI